MFAEVRGQVLGDEPVEEHAEHVRLEVLAVDAAAQIVGDAPDRLMQLGALRFLIHSPRLLRSLRSRRDVLQIR